MSHIYTLLFIFISIMAQATEPNPRWKDVELREETPPSIIHLIEASYNTNLVNIEKQDNQDFINFAVKKVDKNKRFHITVKDGKSMSAVVIDDKRAFFEGDINYSINLMERKVRFGGDITLGKDRLNMVAGGGLNLNQHMSLFYNHDLVIYRINLKHLKNVIVEPVLEEFIYLYIPMNDWNERNQVNLMAQPLSAGVFIRKQVNPNLNIRGGVTSGPSINFFQSANGDARPEILPIVNFRLALDF